VGPIILDSMVRVPEHMLSDTLARQIKRSLTLKSPDMGDYGYGDQKTLRAYTQEAGYLSIPRNCNYARELLQHNKYEDRRAQGTPINVTFSGEHREGQAEFIGRLHQGLLEDGVGTIGQAACGFGKTYCAVNVIALLNTTTLVVVHKEKLGKQFQKTCKDFLGIDVGWVQGSKSGYVGKKVVIATAQTLYQKKLPVNFYTQFGLVVVDEIHRFSAPTFASAITQLPARYRLGVTATPRRGDKMEDIFFWHIGEIEAIGKGKFLDCVVWQVNYDPGLTKGQYHFRGKPNMGKLISALAAHEGRTGVLVRTIAKAVRKGRKILVLSDRVAHLEEMQSSLEKMFAAVGETYSVGIFGSGVSKKARAAQEAAGTADVTLATYQMAMEGVDFPEKDTLVLGTPKGDIEQGVGRIRRLFAGKQIPTVVDICDNVGILRGMAKKRERYYVTPGRDKRAWPVRVAG